MQETQEKKGDSALRPKTPLSICEFSKRVFVVVLAIVAIWILWKAQQVALLTFAGLIVAVVLGGAAHKLALLLPWPRKMDHRYILSLWIVCLTVIAIFTAGFSLVGPRFIEDIKQLESEIPDAIEQVKDFSLVETMLDNGGEDMSSKHMGKVVSKLSSATKSLTSGTISVATGLIYTIFVGLFGAAQPGLYQKVAASFFPPHLRENYNGIFRECIEALGNWLKGQGLAMLIIGTFSGIGLFLIDVRYALTLAILAGLFQFVPYLGPIVSAVPALIVALTMSPHTVLWVALLYLGIQFVEGNFITPVIMKRKADLPPIATLLATVGFGAVFGILGAIVATPLTVMLMVLKQEIYEKRVLIAYEQAHQSKQHG